MGSARERRPVLMIHGVATGGAWEDEIGKTLTPFFDPVQIRYPHYKGPFGALLVICEPWILLLAALVPVALLSAGVPTWDGIAIGSVIALLSVLPVGVRWRRRAALKVLMHQGGKTFDRFPHVIAHSFGTYLTARLLEAVKGLHLSRVVLCGCVLPRHFDWVAHIEAGRVKSVRNDFTLSDWVGIAAKLAGQLHSHLGNAGTHGLMQDSPAVHRLGAPDVECASCLAPQGQASIHDVDCSGLGHSDALLVASHCKMWWLPFLWGHDPAEHCTFLELCRDWAAARHSHDWARIADIETVLARRAWQWCHRQTVRTHLQRALSDNGLANDDHQVGAAFDLLALKVAAASNARLDQLAVRYLDTDLAVMDTVAVLKRLARM